MLEIDAALFAAVPDISIDYAIMEPAAEAGEVAVVRGAFDWSDVGSWQAVAALSVADDDGNRGHGERVAIATRGTYVHAADRIVATVGVENLSSSTRPTPCWSRTAITCSASRKSSASSRRAATTHTSCIAR